jgi:hypothetical protein
LPSKRILQPTHHARYFLKTIAFLDAREASKEAKSKGGLFTKRYSRAWWLRLGKKKIRGCLERKIYGKSRYK